ncbi:MAG: Do family serine endopeptidase [Pseudomonadota bacterium]
MLRSVFAAGLLLVVGTPLALAATAVDFTEVVEDSIPAVVNIQTVRFGTRPDRQPEETQRGQMPEGLPDLFDGLFRGPRGGRGQPDRRGGGSGFIMTEDGLVVTNHHVIDGADEILVRLADRSEYPATLVGSDEQTDIAVLRIESEAPLPTLSFGGTEDLRQGEWVIAIGSPFQYEQSVTAGIVSAKGRSQASQQYVPFIQSDVAINRGNSGGPLIRTDGTVVGINSWILSSNGGNIGLSFAIPSEIAESSIDQLLEFGRVSRGYLGVNIESISRQEAEALELDRPAGAFITGVQEDSPADRAGLQVGDVILRVDGQTIEVHTELPPLIGTIRPGTEVDVDIFRWGEEVTLQVVLEELPQDAMEEDREEAAEGMPSNALGLSVEPLDSDTRRRFGDPEGGVLISQVESDNAYRAGVRRGQVILMINNQPVDSLSDFEDVVEDLDPERSVALLLHLPNGNTTFVAYSPESVN